MDLLGKPIGQYQLVELIHRGQNTVYKGFQPTTNRHVAVKTFAPASAGDPAFVQQFQAEMELVAELQHTNLLPIYDYGQHDNLLYIVARYVEGGTLQNRLPPALSPQAARAMIKPIAAALDYAHSWGAVHGNLKPSNILIDPQGQPLLADMGVFQNIGYAAQGNAYASPEQAQGGAVDGRADVYSLGVLLYEMVIGEPPPLGAAPSPRLKQPELPVEVENVICQAMERRPEHRFQWAGEMNDALARALMPQGDPEATPA